MASESITVTLPASLAQDLPVMAERLLERMHDLLERNTEATLNAREQEELEALVEMAEFAQVVSLAIQRTAS